MYPYFQLHITKLGMHFYRNTHIYIHIYLTYYFNFCLQSPIFKAAQISVLAICNGDIDRPLRVEVYDWDSNVRFLHYTKIYCSSTTSSSRLVLIVITHPCMVFLYSKE